MTTDPPSEIERLPVARLRLDPSNPRLPFGMDGEVSETVIQYYWDHYVLDELIDSFLENGYFEQEPMIVLAQPTPSKATPEEPRKDRGTGKGKGSDETNEATYIVLEGNRRLAALIQLLRLPGHLPKLSTATPSDSRRASLESIPCLVVKDRESVASYVGFKHIGGLKPWPPEAKARFVVAEVQRLAAMSSSTNPFAQVARMVGTNVHSIRLSFFALELLAYARTEYGHDTAWVANHRFGVWLRCLSSSGIRERLKADTSVDYSEVGAALKKVDKKWLLVVLSDLAPRDGRSPILEDSRDVTTYGYILANDRAHRLLRETGDLEVAEQLVSSAALAAKIESVSRRLPALVTEAEQLEDHDEEALGSARNLAGRAKTLVNALRSDEE